MSASPQANRGTGSRRRWRWIALLALVPLILFSTALIISWRMGSSRLDRVMARVDRLDPHWRWDDMQADRRPFPPAELNGSVQVAAIESARSLKAYDEWSFPQYEDDSHKLERAREAMGKSLDGKRKVPAVLNAEQVRVLKAAEVKSGKALALSRDLIRFPYGRFPTVYPKNIWLTALAHCQQVRPVANLLRYDALLRAHNGDLLGAFQNVKAIFHAGRAVGDEPFLIAMLIRIALDHVAVSVLERSLGLGETTEVELRAIQTYLLEQSQIPYFLEGLRGERAADDRVFEGLETGDISANDLIKMIGPTVRVVAADYLLALYARLTLKFRRAEVLELMTDAVEIARMPTEQQAAAYKEWFEKVGNLGWYNVSRMLLPGIERVGEANIRNQAVLRTAIVGIACERFRLANKRWPSKLNELVPSFLDQLPVDPYDGQPLKIKAVDGSFIVYSIGVDRIDDHGQLDNKPFLPGSDIGFRLFDPAKRRQPAKAFAIDEEEENDFQK